MTTFKHGDSVTCTILNRIITDAKISINPDGRVYICQNEHNGINAKNKLGYKYSWETDPSFIGFDIKLARPRTIDDIQVGDVIVWDGVDSPVLMRSGEVVVLGWKTDYGYSASNPFTIAELKHLGYTLKQPEVITKLTVAQIAEKLGNDIYITTDHHVRDVYLNGKKIKQG